MVCNLIRFSLLIFTIAGCVALPHGLKVIKSVGDSQAQIKKYLERQEDLFKTIIKDTLEDKVKIGVSQKRIVKKYGEPTLIKSSQDKGISDIYLYRHPTNYFKSDKIYLYFDNEGVLVTLKYEPYFKK